MKRINLLLIIALGILFSFQSCDKYDPSLGAPPSAEDALFTYAASPDNDNIIEFTALNPDVILKWDLGNGLNASGANVTGIYPNAGTYTVTLTIFTKGGSASSSQEVVIAQTDVSLLDDPLYNMLTGGTSGVGYKTWHIDSLVQGHFGVGPDPVSGLGNVPEWWSANPNDKANVGLYDDRLTFHLTGFQFDMVTNGDVYVHNSLAANFPGSYENLGDFTAPLADQMNETWIITKGADTTLSVSNNSFIGFYSGVHEYRILQISDTSLWLQYQHHAGGLMWYLKLIPDGFESSTGGGGGGGGGGGSTTLPLDFEGTAPDITTFGNSTATVVTNPDQSGINTSANVLETVHGNETWAGFYFDMATPFDFSTNNSITLKVWAPVTGDFRVKLEESANTNNFVEIDGTVTTANSWETITIDFSAASAGVYDRLVLFPGWGVANAGTFYIDDIQQQ